MPQVKFSSICEPCPVKRVILVYWNVGVILDSRVSKVLITLCECPSWVIWTLILENLRNCHCYVILLASYTQKAAQNMTNQ